MFGIKLVLVFTEQSSRFNVRATAVNFPHRNLIMCQKSLQIPFPINPDLLSNDNYCHLLLVSPTALNIKQNKTCSHYGETLKYFQTIKCTFKYNYQLTQLFYLNLKDHGLRFVIQGNMDQSLPIMYNKTQYLESILKN